LPRPSYRCSHCCRSLAQNTHPLDSRVMPVGISGIQDNALRPSTRTAVCKDRGKSVRGDQALHPHHPSRQNLSDLVRTRQIVSEHSHRFPCPPFFNSLRNPLNLLHPRKKGMVPYGGSDTLLVRSCQISSNLLRSCQIISGVDFYRRYLGL
jgi:hypothetical protein